METLTDGVAVAGRTLSSHGKGAAGLEGAASLEGP